MNTKTENRKLEVRDLVTIGIFTAIYFVIFFLSAWTGVFPVMAVFFGALSAFLAGIPMVLFMSKIKKFGMMTIFTLIQGLLNFAMGYGPQVILPALIIGLIADLILKAGKYQSFKAMVLSYVVFSHWMIGGMMPMFILKEAFTEAARATQGDEYVDMLNSLLSNWMIPVVIIAIAICAVLGALLGHAVLKKHFKKAGIV